MHESLRVAPVDRADDLWRPPGNVVLEYATLVRAGFQDVPERTALCVVHDEVQVRRGLECTEQVWGPACFALQGAEQYIALYLRATLLLRVS